MPKVKNKHGQSKRAGEFFLFGALCLVSGIAFSLNLTGSFIGIVLIVVAILSLISGFWQYSIN